MVQLKEIIHALKNVSYIFIGLICIFSLSNCSNKFLLDSSMINYQSKEDPMMAQNSKYSFELNYQIKADAFKKNGIAVITVYQLNSKDTLIKAQKILSAKKLNNIEAKIVSINEQLKDEIKFDEVINKNTINSEYWFNCVTFKASKKNVKSLNKYLESKKISDLPLESHTVEGKVCEGPSMLSDKVQYKYTLKSIPSNFVPDTIKDFVATIYFELNKSVIRESEWKKKEIIQLIDYLSKTEEIKFIEINGYASPDGEIQYNNELADERADEAGKFVLKTLKDNPALKSINFDLNNKNLYIQNKGTEDWSGLLRGIEFARIPQKEDVKKIISNPDLTSEEKQSQLKNLKEVWEIIAEEYLPPLRRASLIVKTKINPKNHEERLRLINASSDQISSDEMLVASEQAVNNLQRIEILEKLKVKFPADYRAYNNLAISDFESNNKESAVKNLMAALELSPISLEVLNNLAFIYFESKEWDKLELLVKKAESKQISLPVYKAILQIRTGKYSSAIKELSPDQSAYLLSLALCLNKNYDKAQDLISVVTPKFAEVYYLSAVIAARMQNTAAVEKNLNLLIQTDSLWEKNLKNDPEFSKYKNTDFFRKIINSK